ncbi:transposase [Planomicrobium okeanokoites]|uniref:Transposase n=1 Tax=Planomicrobium okeanokoites TaxID=244 RepID=A0ABV7KNF7_PLAOK
MGRSYTPEYKAYVVKLILEEGRKATEVSRDLEIPYGTLNKWVDHERKKRAGIWEEEDIPLTPSEYKKRLAAIEKELQNSREENEILKKAMHIFTKNRE